MAVLLVFAPEILSGSGETATSSFLLRSTRNGTFPRPQDKAHLWGVLMGMHPRYLTAATTCVDRRASNNERQVHTFGLPEPHRAARALTGLGPVRRRTQSTQLVSAVSAEPAKDGSDDRGAIRRGGDRGPL